MVNGQTQSVPFLSYAEYWLLTTHHSLCINFFDIYSGSTNWHLVIDDFHKTSSDFNGHVYLLRWAKWNGILDVSWCWLEKMATLGFRKARIVKRVDSSDDHEFLASPHQYFPSSWAKIEKRDDVWLLGSRKWFHDGNCVIYLCLLYVELPWYSDMYYTTSRYWIINDIFKMSKTVSMLLS